MKIKLNEISLLLGLTVIVGLLFVILYAQTAIQVEKPLTNTNNTTLQDWTVDQSVANGAPLVENKDIYGEPDNDIYDVYITVFPTKDENGETLVFSDFDKHQPRDHSYNPTLNCNIQILEEGGTISSTMGLDTTNATIRVRGNSSRGDEYKSYKIKLDDEAESFMGQTSLNINKHSEDVSKITTKFCTDVLVGMDNIVSYRTNFMRVWIRDASLPENEQEYKYYGLYTHIEQPNKQYLEDRGLSSNCVMYKARDFSFAMREELKNVDDPDYSVEEFEKVLGIREGNDHTKLLEMIAAVNDPTANFEEVFAKYFNEDNYLTWLAFNLLVGGEDILNHNFILYSPNYSNTWYFIPWDFDSNLTTESDTLPPSLRGGQKLNQVSLHRKYFRIPGNLDKLKAKMEEIMKEHMYPERIQQLTAGYMPVLEKTMMLEPDIGLLNDGMTPADLPAYIQSFPEFIERRYQEFLTAFEYPAPMFVSIPVKNEDDTLHLAWESSYSYQGRTITYNVTIANDCFMNDVLYEKEGVVETTLDADINLSPGTYYLKVTAVDSEGNEQLSLEHYEFAGAIFIYESGILEFVVE